MSKLTRLITTMTILCTTCIQPSHPFSMNMNMDGSSNNSNNKRHISAAEQARRAEDQRRKQRANEAIPGRTSAIQGAKDFEINVKRTELEWTLQASGIDQQVKNLNSKGLDDMRMLRLEDANEAFEQAYQLKPHSYCWQAGVVKFYLGDYERAAEWFVRNANYYEMKFGQVASEERIWRDACELKLLHSVVSKSKRHLGLDPPMITMDERDEETGPKETRKVIRIAGELFAASVDRDLSAMALARAKLRSICGEYDADSKGQGKKLLDLKMWRLSAWFYLGLHYDVTGDEEGAKECMKMALRQCIGGNGNDIIQALPMLHMARRDWFDDDTFDEDVGFNPDDDDNDEDDFNWNGDGDIQGQNTKSMQKAKADKKTESNYEANAIQSIKESVQGMKISELQVYLRQHGKKSSGSKSMLRDRLVQCMIEEAGLSDEFNEL